jgi:alanyl-tRNA synthetase
LLQVLLTIAGMLPFKPVFLGQAVRPAARVTTTQKCESRLSVLNAGGSAATWEPGDRRAVP